MARTYRRVALAAARVLLLLVSGVLATAALLTVAQPALPVAAAPCDPPPVGNPIVCENLQPGNPQSEWDLPTLDAGDPSMSRKLG